MKAVSAGEASRDSNVVELGQRRALARDWRGALAEAKAGFETQMAALSEVASRLDDEFEAALEILLECAGRVVVSGIGKSGLIGRKLASTLASTGTPSVFLHPAEAHHGDLGMVREEDVVLFVCYSGETPEVTSLLPYFLEQGIPIVAIVGHRSSTLARASEAVLDVSVEREACPHNLAPTTSALVSLAMGDALAVALMRARGFDAQDFGRLHPGGSLGKKLRLVSDTMHRDNLPFVPPTLTVGESLFKISEGRCGLAIVVDEAGQLAGIVTDGDLRRALTSKEKLLDTPISEIMTRKPVTIREDATLSEAEARMQRLRLKALIVLNSEDRVSGVIEVFK